jgi:ferritin-like metal-binding protein YciE
MKITNATELLTDMLQDVYSAETQLLKALPKMVQKATAQPLRKAFENHLEETKDQVRRLEQVFEILGADPEGEHCEVMEGLVEEAEQLIKAISDKDLLDAALIGAAQKVEHYEIASYGTILTFAKLLNDDKIAEILGKTIDEEKKADMKLTELAEHIVNQKAIKVE